jgi:DNA segregation ATPase FtsK/SpoIIIE, S-DNA-T family
MFDDRNLKLDLIALGLLAATVFLAGALLSYEPSDPPSQLVHPPSTETQNVCGRLGAFIAQHLFEGIGLGAYYLLASLALLDFFLLARKEIDQPVLRMSGWLLSLLGVSTLVAIALPHLSPGPVIGSGGYLGAMGQTALLTHCAAVGAYTLTVCMILVGLLLSTDYFLIRLLALSIGTPARSVGRTALTASRIYQEIKNNKKPTAVRTDLDKGDIEITIGGRKIDQAPEEDEWEYEEVEVDEAEDDQIEVKEAEEEKKTKQKPKTDSRELKIRKPRDSKSAAPASIHDQLDEAGNNNGPTDYELPPLELLLPQEPFAFEEQEKDVRRKAKILEQTFRNFGLNVRVVEIQTGPVIAQFEIELEAGLRLSRVTSLADDLAIAMKVPSVRIVAPIPGKNTVGIEVPNNERQLVRLREVIEEAENQAQKMRIPIYMGKNVSGNSMVVDLAQMPHLLIAGRTGTGKSVCLNSIIVSMLMTRRPDEVRMLMIDPKMVELSPYKKLPHLMHPVVTDMRKAEAILGWAVEKMEERYQLLARAGVRHLSAYNQLGEEELYTRLEIENDEQRAEIPVRMPYIVIVADEIADLMMTSPKEVETHIIRLAQKSRAVGIHLVLATQKPTVDVITGLIKSNLPARVAFQVASRVDSRVVLDEMGADKLLGNGDMLFLWPGTSQLIRGQGTYLSDDEITRVIDSVATSEPQFATELVQLPSKDADGEGRNFADRDELYEAAVDVVVRERRGSVSLLQRALGIGYGRAARLVDFMAEDGFVGPYNGSQAREVLLSTEDWDAMTGNDSSTPATPAKQEPTPPPRRDNTIRLAEPSPPFDPDLENEEKEDEPIESTDDMIEEVVVTPKEVTVRNLEAAEEDEIEDEDEYEYVYEDEEEDSGDAEQDDEEYEYIEYEVEDWEEEDPEKQFVEAEEEES